jgi:hypothetical protein
MRQHTLHDDPGDQFAASLPSGAAESLSQDQLETEPAASEALTVDSGVIKLTDHLKREARIQRRENLMAGTWGVALFIVLARAGSQFSSGYPAMLANWRHLFVIFLLLCTGMMVQGYFQSRRRKRDLTRALSNSAAIDQVSALVSTVTLPNTAIRNLSKQHLIALLPQVKASDASLFGAAERTILIRRLSISPADPGYRDLSELFSRQAYRREVALRVAILKAMEQVGGKRELPYVEALARETSRQPRALKTDPEIQAAARECLPFLQARVDDQRASAQLLRASSADAGQPNELLRASVAEVGDPGTLLRAGSVKEGG